MWLVSTFEKIYLKKIFFVSTFLDWYKNGYYLFILLKNKKMLSDCCILNRESNNVATKSVEMTNTYQGFYCISLEHI